MFTLLDNIYSSFGWLIFVILSLKLLGNACNVELLSILFYSKGYYASNKLSQMGACI